MSAIAITVNGEWRGGFIIPLFFTGACIGKAIAYHQACDRQGREENNLKLKNHHRGNLTY